MKNYGALGIRIAKRGASRHIFLSLYIKVLEFGIKFRALSPYRLWDLIKFRIPPFIWALGLGKIPNSPPLCGPWDWEKFHAGASSQALGLLRKIRSSASIEALRFEKMLSFPFLRLQPAGEVSLFCLLHKLQTLPFNLQQQASEVRVFGEATSSNTSRAHTTSKLIMVDVPLTHPIQALGLGKIPSHPPPPAY